jgi:hypothetical protein
MQLDSTGHAGLWALRAKLKGESVGVVFDHGTRSLKNAALRAIILSQMEEPVAGEIFLKPGKEPVIRSPEGIDGLIRVSDHQKPAAIRGQELDQEILDLIDILKLVYQDKGEPVPIFLQDRRVRLQQFDHFEQHIVIIIGMTAMQQALVCQAERPKILLVKRPPVRVFIAGMFAADILPPGIFPATVLPAGARPAGNYAVSEIGHSQGFLKPRRRRRLAGWGLAA